MMETPIRTVRISETGRDGLILLKRFTGIDQWNILCRWALCRSLKERHPPSGVAIGEMSGIEIEWETFGGPYGDLLLALVRQRCHEDDLGTEDATVAEQFKLHLHRGIAALASSGEAVRSIEDLIGLALPELNVDLDLVR